MAISTNVSIAPIKLIDMQTIPRALWTPRTYTNFKRYIDYFNHQDPVFSRLALASPVVKPERVHATREHIQQCENRKGFLLHIGDCAEPFEHASEHILSKKIQFLRNCQEALQNRKKTQAYLIGRIAGQYAKPRSTEFVIKDGVKMHNYKGDNVNSVDEGSRDPCEHKLFEGYLNSAKIAKYIELHYPELSVSHEGLILPYEASLTRKVYNDYLCLSAHMIWIGERTRQLDGAHVQFFRGIGNPIGVKVSSNISQKDFLNLVSTLNPNNQKGKLLVITRMGKQKIKGNLEKLVKIKQNEGLNFLFVTDAMHGNTFESKPTSLKTRNASHILEEIHYFEDCMKENGLGYGYSLEATFEEDATECHGLSYPFTEAELEVEKFSSKCDPRLNRGQTLSLIQQLSV